ncbi:MAG: 4Fe-4S binding protein [Bacteroidetes bacterium]|nr:4Fe-4S binding protein [Bacteroidota bacterium]
MTNSGIDMTASLFTNFCFAIQRFPKPEFESGYIEPETLLPLPRGEMLAWLDVAVLILALSLASWLILKKRSRMGVFWLSLFSLVYFGFYRQGCVCSIGAIQNVTLGIFTGNYTVPLVALIFFLAPLIFTLLFGRTFCAAVCPFGALQDMVAVKPMRMGASLNALLGMIPYLYLGMAILFAATATDFIICRYDPFVGIFRLNSSFGMFLFAGILLVSGIFIARPYCRFLCPYGVLLNWMSRLSWKHMTITPAECIQCRLCENSCPYDAIDYPQTKKDPIGRRKQVNRMILLVVLLPLLIVGGAWMGGLLHQTFAGVNPKVKLVRMLLTTDASKDKPEPPEIAAFRSSGIPQTQLMAEVAAIERDFLIGSRIFGGFIGLAFGLTLIGLIRTPYRTDYIPNRGSCFSCGKCMDYCPVESKSCTVNTEVSQRITENL